MLEKKEQWKIFSFLNDVILSQEKNVLLWKSRTIINDEFRGNKGEN